MSDSLSRLQQRLIAQYKRHPVEAYERKDGASVMSEFLEQQTGEHQQKPMARAHELLRDTPERDEIGAITGRLTYPGAVIAGLALALVAAVGVNTKGDAETISIEAEAAALQSVTAQLSPDCYFTYESRIDGIKVKHESKKNIWRVDEPVPYGNWTTVTLNIHESAEACNKASDIKMDKVAINPKTEKQGISLALGNESPMYIKSWPTNPADTEMFSVVPNYGKYVEAKKVVLAQVDLVAIDIDGTEILDVKGLSRRESGLAGIGLVAAAEINGKQCGVAAYKAGLPEIEQAIIGTYYERYKQFKPEGKLHKSDFFISSMPKPEDLEIVTNYDKPFEVVKKQQGIKVSGVKQGLVCENSTDVTVNGVTE